MGTFRGPSAFSKQLYKVDACQRIENPQVPHLSHPNIIGCMCLQVPSHHALFSSQDTFSSSINDLSDKGEEVSCVFADT